MAVSERVPLLGEKSETLNKHELPQFRRNECPQSRNLARALLLPFLCAGALYGSYTFCDRARPNRAEKNPSNPSIAAVNYTCVPGASCWPTSQEWSAFNRSIDGNLKLTIPWAAPCYSNPSSKECQAVVSDYGDGDSRTEQYGSMEFLNWETCGKSQCTLNPYNPLSPVSGECSLGRLSTYHVEARTADTISKTIKFSHENGIRVSIKNTGHDYFGRSNAANSLAIWTHNMKDLKYHKTFLPQGCQTQYEHIGEVGAGIQAQEAWEFFEKLNMMVTVGAVGSVGIAGGFGQGGGHGPLGPTYGLMVDQAVEFDVVTADGQFRTINECSDPDLFWAMRGGGGGNYAVLTAYRFQLHQAVPMQVYSFQATFPQGDSTLDISKSQVHRDIIGALAKDQSSFLTSGIAGYNFIHADHICSLQVVPANADEKIKSITSEWHEFLTNYPGLNVTENTYHTFPTFSEWHKFTETPEISRNGPVGLGLAESGRFIPKGLFRSDSDIESVVDAVVNAMQFSYENNAGGSAQLYATGPYNHHDNSKTGVNPAWRDSMWHVIMGAGWPAPTAPHQKQHLQKTISASIQPFKDITPGGSCYMNEGDWMEEDWKQTFFGENYDRLLAVKRQYDPTGLFNCWKCVGWTGYEDPMYSCYEQSKAEPQPTIPLGPVE